MKILLVDQIFGVCFPVTVSLAKALSEHGDVTLVTDEIPSAVTQLKNSFGSFKIFPLFNTGNKKIKRFHKLFNYLSAYRHLARLIKKEKFDIVIVQWFSFSPVDFYYLKRISKNTKIVVMVNDISAFDSKKMDTIFYPKLYNLASAIVLMAKSNISRFAGLYPNLAGKCCFIPLGNTLGFGFDYPKTKARDRLGLPQDSFVFLFFGQIKKIKGVDLLIRAFGEFSKIHPDSYLVIAGNSRRDDPEKYSQLIANLGLKNCLTSFRYIPDEEVKYFFGSADISVLPYTDVYQSAVVQLTYSYHRAAIVSDLKPFLDVVVDQKTGFVFKSGDVSSLTETMERAYFERDHLNDFAAKGRQRIEDLFSWHKIGQDYSALFDSLVKGSFPRDS